jgi:hypothetical protein
LLELARGLHHGELVPAGEVGQISVRHGQYLVERAVLPAFAKPRRHDIVDDAIVERIARDRDAGILPSAWLRSSPFWRAKRMTEKSLVPPPKSPTNVRASAASSRAKK